MQSYPQVISESVENLMGLLFNNTTSYPQNYPQPVYKCLISWKTMPLVNIYGKTGNAHKLILAEVYANKAGMRKSCNKYGNRGKR